MAKSRLDNDCLGGARSALCYKRATHGYCGGFSPLSPVCQVLLLSPCSPLTCLLPYSVKLVCLGLSRYALVWKSLAQQFDQRPSARASDMKSAAAFLGLVLPRLTATLASRLCMRLCSGVIALRRADVVLSRSLRSRSSCRRNLRPLAAGGGN